MLDYNYIPDNVLTDLLDALDLPDEEHSYAHIASLPTEQLFNIWLKYNGIVGYANDIISALDGLREAEQQANKPQ